MYTLSKKLVRSEIVYKLVYKTEFMNVTVVNVPRKASEIRAMSLKTALLTDAEILIKYPVIFSHRRSFDQLLFICCILIAHQGHSMN